MSGRAGRTGFDKSGHSILLCSAQERRQVEQLFEPFANELESAVDENRIVRAVLEAVSSNLVSSLAQLKLFLLNTLRGEATKATESCRTCEKTAKKNKHLFSDRTPDG